MGCCVFSGMCKLSRACRLERVDKKNTPKSGDSEVPRCRHPERALVSRVVMAARIPSRNVNAGLWSVFLPLEQSLLQMCSEATYIESLLKSHISISAKSEFLKPDNQSLYLKSQNFKFKLGASRQNLGSS